ncbi:MAG: HD domain-containing protein, partial [Glaciimonas sp.]|nr:HD domain-containing protein [Glaciimonas sp.]
MVAIASTKDAVQVQLCAGLNADDSARVLTALAFVQPLYEGKVVTTGQTTLAFSQGVANVLALLNTDVETRMAGLLFELLLIDPANSVIIEKHFGNETSDLVVGIRQLMRLHGFTFALPQEVMRGKNAAQQAASQVETLRKMLLAMASDMRVVLVRLASRLAALRYFAAHKLQNERTSQYAHETLDLYAPL